MPNLSNKELLARATGITKSEGGAITLDTTDFDGHLPREHVDEMINLVRDQSGLLGSIRSVTRSQKTGVVHTFDVADKIMEFVGELDTTQVKSELITGKSEYHTRKAKVDIVLSHDEIVEANAAEGLPGDFEKEVLDSVTLQLGNNIADAAMNGDRTLDASTRYNRSLRGVNGIDILTSNGANIENCMGAKFNKHIFNAIADDLPSKWRGVQDGHRWFYSHRLQNAYNHALTGVQTPMGDMMHSSMKIMPPLGVEPILVPQIREDKGGTAIAPTSVADNTTSLQLVLSTLVAAGDPETIANGVGRRFLVTNTTTGESEVCTGFQDTTLRINTVGLLGQTAGSVSTTASDYEVRPADETSILYANPQMITIVWLGDWRVHRRYNQHSDGVEITMYVEFDLLVPVPQSMVKYTNIALPKIDWKAAA